MRQRHAAAGLQELVTGDSTTSKPHASSWRPTRGGQAGITMVVPTTTELAQKRQGLVVLEHERLGHQRLDRPCGRSGPRRAGRTMRPAVVERAEREVEVVEAGVDQLDRPHRRRRAAGPARRGRRRRDRKR